MISLLLLCIIVGEAFSNPRIAVVILSQKSEVHNKLALDLEKSILAQSKRVEVVNTVRDFPDCLGSWSIFPILESIFEKHKTDWYLFVEPETEINLAGMATYIAAEDATIPSYFGFALQDSIPTIIHHFHGFDKENVAQLLYPDWSAGMLVSNSLMNKIIETMKENKFFNNFAIDPRHEFARFIEDNLNVRLQARNKIFCLFESSTCVSQYKAFSNSNNICSNTITDNTFYVAVKTFSDYHRTRLVVAKRTWANTVLHLEYISDIEDQFVPTITLGIDNTERGHCAKTFAILKHFAHKEKQNKFDWLVIADDDTLLSISRLKKLLQCFDSNETLIIGERYGYGFNHDGTSGYDYPTGGSGMVFSRPAVHKILKRCTCPQPDSPDDMILGMCASAYDIPIIHSPAFHQARYMDYASEYIKKINPISFHKLEDIDPYADYVTYLKEEDVNHEYRHTEL